MWAWDSSLAIIDIALFVSAIKAYYDAKSGKERHKAIQRMLNMWDWHEHYSDRNTGRKVLSELPTFKHTHELRSAILLAQMNYDVVFAPAAIFHREQKKFDVYLLKDLIMLEADLKYILSQSPLTIANRIKDGSEQASRVVLDISSPMDVKAVIEGLRKGVHRNRLIREILLLYKKKLYRLPKNLIMNNRIFDILKNEKGYT